MPRRPIYKHAGIIVKVKKGKEEKKGARKPLPNKQVNNFTVTLRGMRQNTNIFAPLPRKGCAKCVLEVKVNQFRVEKTHVKMGTTPFNLEQPKLRVIITNLGLQFVCLHRDSFFFLIITCLIVFMFSYSSYSFSLPAIINKVQFNRFEQI